MSPEEKKHADADEHIVKSYQKVLRRQPDTTGLVHYRERLASGEILPSGLDAELANSAEARALSMDSRYRAELATVGVSFEETCDGSSRMVKNVNGVLIQNKNGSPFVLTTADAVCDPARLQLFDSETVKDTEQYRWEFASSPTGDYAPLDREVSETIEFAYAASAPSTQVVIRTNEATVVLASMTLQIEMDTYHLRRVVHPGGFRSAEVNVRMWPGSNAVQVEFLALENSGERMGGVQHGDAEIGRVRFAESGYNGVSDTVAAKLDLRRFTDSAYLIRNNNFGRNALRDRKSSEIAEESLTVLGIELDETTNRKTNGSSYQQSATEHPNLEGARLVFPAMGKRMASYSGLIQAVSNNSHTSMQVRFYYNPERVRVRVSHQWYNYYGRPATNIAVKIPMQVQQSLNSNKGADEPKIRHAAMRPGARATTTRASNNRREREGIVNQLVAIQSDLIDTGAPTTHDERDPAITQNYPIEQGGVDKETVLTRELNGELLMRARVVMVDPMYNIVLLAFDADDCYAALKPRIAQNAVRILDADGPDSIDFQFDLNKETEVLKVVRTFTGENPSSYTGRLHTMRYYPDHSFFETYGFDITTTSHHGGAPLFVFPGDGNTPVLLSISQYYTGDRSTYGLWSDTLRGKLNTVMNGPVGSTQQPALSIDTPGNLIMDNGPAACASRIPVPTFAPNLDFAGHWEMVTAADRWAPLFSQIETRYIYDRSHPELVDRKPRLPRTDTRGMRCVAKTTGAFDREADVILTDSTVVRRKFKLELGDVLFRVDYTTTDGVLKSVSIGYGPGNESLSFVNTVLALGSTVETVYIRKWNQLENTYGEIYVIAVSVSADSHGDDSFYIGTGENAVTTFTPKLLPFYLNSIPTFRSVTQFGKWDTVL